MNTASKIKTGMYDAIPIGLGYFAVSFTFGMMAVTDGLAWWDAVIISLTNVTSAGQFAGLSIIAAKGSLFEMALTQLVINLRYSLMSFSLSQKLDDSESRLHRFFVAFGVTDEIFGITASLKGKASVMYMYGAMLTAIPGWVLGTLVGGIFGNILPTMVLSALGIAIYGMFLAIVIPPAKHERSVLAAVVGAMTLSAGFKYLPLLNKLSAGFIIVIVTVVVSGVCAALFPHIGE